MMPGPALPSGQHVPSGHASALPSGHATLSSSILEAYRLFQEEEMNGLRNGQAVANTNIQLLLEFTSHLTSQLNQSHEGLVRQMTEQRSPYGSTWTHVWLTSLTLSKLMFNTLYKLPLLLRTWHRSWRANSEYTGGPNADLQCCHCCSSCIGICEN
jgi:hypothetical protein